MAVYRLQGNHPTPEPRHW